MKKMSDIVCKSCKGSKKVDGVSCKACNGSGLRDKNMTKGVEK